MSNYASRLPTTIVTSLKSTAAIIDYRQIFGQAIKDGWDGSFEQISDHVLSIFPKLCDSEKIFINLAEEWKDKLKKMKRKDKKNAQLRSALFRQYVLGLWPLLYCEGAPIDDFLQKSGESGALDIWLRPTRGIEHSPFSAEEVAIQI